MIQPGLVELDQTLAAIRQHVIEHWEKYPGNPGHNSLHEVYGVMLEEMDEFWEEVKKHRAERDLLNARWELIQIASVCANSIVMLVEPLIEEQIIRART